MPGMVGNTGNLITEHPYASAGIAVGVVLLVWYFSSGSGPQASAPQDNSAAAAQVAAVNANAASANLQTTAAQAVSIAGINASLQAALAQAGASTSVAQYQSQADIAASNNNASIAFSHDAAATTISGNASIASEFGSVADMISAFGKVLDTNQNAGINSTDLENFLSMSEHNTTFLASQVTTNQLLALQGGEWTTNNPLGTNVLAEVLGQTQAGSGQTAGAGPGGIVAPGVSLSAAQLATLFQGPTSSSKSALSSSDFAALANSLVASIGKGVTTSVQANGAAFHAQ